MGNRFLKKTRAQSTAEFAALFALIVGAVVAMQIYVRRGLQAKQKDAVVYVMKDVLGMNDTDEFQYEPYYQSSNIVAQQSQREESHLYSGLRSNYSSYQNITYNPGSTERQEGWNATILTEDKM